MTITHRPLWSAASKTFQGISDEDSTAALHRHGLSQVAATTHPGESGQALWRTLDIGDIRVRMVEVHAGLSRRSLVPPI